MTTMTINNGNGPAVGVGEALGVVPQQAAPGEGQVPAADEAAVAASVAAALDPQLVARLAAQARAQGVSLLGRDGLLQQVTKRYLEATLAAEMDEHLGYGRHEATGRDGGNSRNGYRSKTLLTEVGPVRVEVPRDRDASFTPRATMSGSGLRMITVLRHLFGALPTHATPGCSLGRLLI